MSTSVDKQQPPSKQLDLNSVARQRSISHSNGSVSPNSVETGHGLGTAPRSPKKSSMAQTQRSRYLKTAAIVGVVFMLLLWMSPSKPSYPRTSFSSGMPFRKDWIVS